MAKTKAATTPKPKAATPKASGAQGAKIKPKNRPKSGTA